MDKNAGKGSQNACGPILLENLMSEIVYPLKNPVTFEGKTYENFVFDFDRLTGRDVKEAKKLFDAPGGRITPILAMDTDFAAFIAARAAKVRPEVFDYISASDFISITQMAINFFLSSGFSKAEVREMKLAKENADQKLIESFEK